ncbi:phosphotyrosine protein phosphatase [Massilia dura]|uniref:Phosphotyrosine protein phosphatase n=1 Tax=Pseudoduganella dura TaxID=321982 RepID=A0A6I3XBU2_9BURK|nr:phosphotyrosine protein phosphatase [Pseudoduganella dura]
MARKTGSEAGGRKNILFVCSKNQWRSPTAEAIWRSHPDLNVRSGGTSPNARHHVSEDDIRWADVICVMEEKHKARLKAEYTRVLDFKAIHVLDIPDEYRYMDAELVEQLKQCVPSILMIE